MRLTGLVLSASCLLLAACGDKPEEGETLTIDRLVGSPSLDGPSVNGLKISPDGMRVTFLKGKESDFRVQDLWEYDIASGETRLLVDSADILGGREEELSEVEKARRERQRITAKGIVEYVWSKDGDALLFPLDGDLFYLPLGGEPRRLTETEAFETDAKFSPKGNFVSFIREQNLYVIEVESGAETQLSTEGGGPILMGMAEFVAQEEMDRDTGYWWSPDESLIALTRVDESPVKEVDRYELGADGGVTTISQRYPFAGTENARIDLGYVPVEGGDIRWIDLGEDEDIYLPRVKWLPDSRHLSFQRQSRDQTTLELIIADTVTGAQTTPVTETSQTWVNLHHDLHFLEDTDRFIWSSERSGYRHVYLFDREGTMLGQLTAGDWAVDAVEAVDETAGRVYFTGFADTPLERHLYSAEITATLEPDAPVRVTSEEGWHGVDVNTDGGIVIDNYSAPRVPPKVALKSIDGAQLAMIEANALDDAHPYAPYLGGHSDKSYGTIAAADGTALYYSLAKPADFDPGREYPAIVQVYGGPGVQRVRKAWMVDFDQILTRNGYVVFKLDNRGSAHRGKTFEDVLYRAMAETEVADQVRGAEWLAEQPFIDADRIGVYGWSYGGYMTLHLLARAPELYAGGMSVAPVSDWRLYDTHYTERYLGKPGEGDVYDRASLFPYIEGIAPGSLLLVHGMADDNVFFDHSVKAMTALQTQRTPFDLMTYPGKRHGIRGEDARAHLWTQALRFFDSRIKGR